MPTPNLSPVDEFEWRNWHVTRDVGGHVRTFFTPRNRWIDGTPPAQKFQAGIGALQAIVQQAERDARRVRAVGSGWSLNNVAFTTDYLVNTSRLDEWFVGFTTPSMLVPEYQPRRDRMVFAQGGVQIKVLNGYLEQQRLSLPTSGASNGQTLGGAVSTGTHGAANGVGAMPDYMLGMHLIAEGGRSYFIQRSSRPAASQEFCDWLGAESVLDDELFNAAIVSFGSFGLIHGLLFEAEPVFVLEKRVWQKHYPDVIATIGSLDVTDLGLPGGAELPFHFEIVINPYRLKATEEGAFVRFMYKRILGANERLPAPPQPPGGVQTTEDLVALAGTVSDVVPALIPDLLQNELVDSLAPTPAGKSILGTHGQIFADTLRTNGGNSMEIGVPLHRVADAVKEVLDVCAGAPFGAPLALRYVKGSSATLAFTSFDGIVCALELPGIDSARTREGFRRIQQALAATDIPHAYHWGQQLPLSPDWVGTVFGARRDRWLAARRSFLSAHGRHTFANALLESVGLAD